LYQYLSNQEVVSQVDLFMEKFPNGDPFTANFLMLAHGNMETTYSFLDSSLDKLYFRAKYI